MICRRDFRIIRDTFPPVSYTVLRDAEGLILTERTPDSTGKTAISAESVEKDFGTLYEYYLSGVYRYVHYRVGETEIAEDLTSDIFDKALTGFNKFDPAKASFSTWIFSIARNTVVDHYRKRSREVTLRTEPPADIPSETLLPDEQMAESEEKIKLHECLLKLKTQEQEIIALKFSGNMTNREIGVITGLSESNVGTILCRTIRKLRDDFSGW